LGPLADRALFEQVRIDTDAQTLVWPNGADFDPRTLHDWPEVAEGFAKQAAAWKAHSKRRAVAEDREEYGCRNQSREETT